MKYAVGSLVKARNREWVVMPESSNDLLILRPLGGSEDEVTGIYIPLENVEPAQFDLPDTGQIGDYNSCRLLGDAVKLGFRSSAGPFRSFARLSVDPRPYQLVPLLMALKQDPVRILIADDVGIGKTVEACLIARELIDRGEVQRMAVLCPPHLGEQWQKELKEKFHIEAELVLASTAARLEKNCGIGQSLFELYPYVIVSMDFIKSDRRRNEFIRTCPELVIVDEAHTCAYAEQGQGVRHQRYKLLSGLSQNTNRHMILLTATPHSGKEEAFRSLLTFLGKDFANLPQDLSGKENEKHRRQLAKHFVQRRRADIRQYMELETPFPEREDADVTYTLSPDYKKLFNRALNYAKETVKDLSGGSLHQRIRWWSALALLRSLSSSPAAAAATLRSRAVAADTDTIDAAEDIGSRAVLDLDIEENADNLDIIPGSDIGELSHDEQSNRRLLLDMAKEAETLYGNKDSKLIKAINYLQQILEDGYNPIVFCRFIPTAEYLVAELRKRLPKTINIEAVTGILPPKEREERIAKLSESPKRILIATDCLSEGINLQEYFDAVFHYDLSWNPTRHEQREGRVDRYGQPKQKVRVLTYYGLDNQIDGIVLDVLISKHRKIRSSLGISVPVPVDTNSVINAIFEGLLLKGHTQSQRGPYEQLAFDFMQPTKEDLFAKWDDISNREKKSRTMFAQETIKVEEVARELKAVRESIGSGVDIRTFMKDAFKAFNVTCSGDKIVTFDLNESSNSLRDAVGCSGKLKVKYELPVDSGIKYINRTHPVVEGLASYVMNTALDPLSDTPARRCGVIRTKHVDVRTTVLLLRLRYHIITKRGNVDRPLLAEDCQVIAFKGSLQSPVWLKNEDVESILSVLPDENISLDQKRYFLEKLIENIKYISPFLNDLANQRGKELLDAHQRVREASRQAGISYRVEPHLPPDILGIYIYLPVS